MPYTSPNVAENLLSDRLWVPLLKLSTMNMENQLLVIDEPVEFENYPVEVQDFKKITGHFRGS